MNIKEKVSNVLKLVIYYLAIYLISKIRIENLPVGAIGAVAAAYSSGGMLAPVMVVSLISSVIPFSVKTLVIYIIFSVIFSAIVLFVRPLESIEGRNEKKKLFNYLLAILIPIYIFSGIKTGIYGIIFSLGIYKIFVNLLPVILNKEKIEFFSIEEEINILAFLVIISTYIVKMFNLPTEIALGTIAIILGYSSIKKSAIVTLVVETLGYILLRFYLPIGEYINAYYIIIVIASICILLRYMKKIYGYIFLTILNIAYIFIAILVLKNPLSIVFVLAISITAAIVLKDYEYLKLKKHKNEKLLSDEGENRLQTEKEYIINQEINRKDKRDLKNEIKYFQGEKEEFFTRMYEQKEEIFKSDIFEDSEFLDRLLDEIYELLKTDEYIDCEKYQNILYKNNIVIDIKDKETIEEIRYIEKHCMKTLKQIVREKEEIEYKKKREKEQERISHNGIKDIKGEKNE